MTATTDITAVHPPGTAIDTLQPAGGVSQYQAGIVMTPESAKALDEQVRLCTEAVLREGTDYGIIPGTSGEKTLWRPGAQKLLQWFRLECICERIEVERDDEGRKHGITYRAEVGRGLKTATPVILATCEGTADYDEKKFYKTAEQVQRDAEDRERANAERYRRVARPTKWQGLPEYRADWNALMKRAQKRAIVGAVNDATAAGGIFTDREEDDGPAPALEGDGPTWYEQALEDALTFTSQEAGRQMYTDAAQAGRDGLCTPRQATHIQNRIEQRARLLKRAATVDAEDLARQAGDGPARRTAAAGGSTRSQRGDQAPRHTDEHATHPAPAAAGDVAAREPQHLPPPAGEDETHGTYVVEVKPDTAATEPLEPGEAAEYGTERHRKMVGLVWQHLGRLGYPGEKKETDQDKTRRLADVARLAGVAEIGSTSDLDLGELTAVIDTLTRCKNADALQALLNAGGGDD